MGLWGRFVVMLRVRDCKKGNLERKQKDDPIRPFQQRKETNELIVQQSTNN